MTSNSGSEGPKVPGVNETHEEVATGSSNRSTQHRSIADHLGVSVPHHHHVASSSRSSSPPHITEGGRRELRRLIPTVKTVSFDDLAILESHDGVGMRTRNSSFFLSRGGNSSAMLTLVCSTLGASVLTLPYAFSRSGIFFGVLTLWLCGGLTVFSIYLLVRISDLTGASTYEGIGGRLFGPQFQKLVEIVMITFCFGVGVGYVVAIRDTLAVLAQLPHYPALLSGPNGVALSTTLFWAIFIFPLSCSKKLTSLRFVTFTSVVCVTYVSTFVIFNFLKQIYDRWGHHHILDHHVVFGIRPANDMLIAIPLLMFCYCCQPNVLEVYQEMKEPCVMGMTKTGGKAISLCSTLYMVSAVCGYLSFGGFVQQNILGNFSPTADPFATLAFFCIMMAITLAMPLTIIPTREACSLVLEHETLERLHIPLTFVITGAALLLGLLCPGIASVFGFLGGACGSLIGFVFPALYALRCDMPGKPIEVLGTWFLLIFGVVAGSIGSWVSLFPSQG